MHAYRTYGEFMEKATKKAIKRALKPQKLTECEKTITDYGKESVQPDGNCKNQFENFCSKTPRNNSAKL